MINPLVSVCLITYMHENYIRQAIESILIQKVNFPFELIIADDCSPDQTRAIIEEYKNQHSSLIRLLFQKKNVGAGRNFVDLINSAQGKYIAYLEGDDYWTDSLKLQKQVDFLEKFENYICIGHNANIVNEMDNSSRLYFSGINGKIERSQIVRPIGFPTASVLFRNIFSENKVPQILLENPLDTVLFTYLSYYGDFYLSEDIMSVYRIHLGGVQSRLSHLAAINKTLNLHKFLMRNFSINNNEKKEISIAALELRLNRLNINSNRFNFGYTFIIDFIYIIKCILNRTEVNYNFVIFCILPNVIFGRIQKLFKKSTVI